MDVTVVDSGYGNLHSVLRALTEAGGTPMLTDDPAVVRRAERLVVPGQGAFGQCMAALVERGLDDALREVIAADRPFLGICLGLQILFDESEEHGPVAGLGVIPGRVVRFRPSDSRLKVPHMGWNRVEGTEPLVTDGQYFYFVHSYHVVPARPEDAVLTADYGGRFAAAVRRGNLFACQFHPEKSQRAGLALLARFLEGA